MMGERIPQDTVEPRLRPLRSDGLVPGFHENIASQVMTMFRWSLIATVTLTLALCSLDAFFIGVKVVAPADRLITERVIMMIVGASIVQIGAAMIAIVYAMFRATPKD